MPRARRKSKGKGTAVPLDSDDEANFVREPVPDKRNDDYYEDEIDQFHSSRDKVLLDKTTAMAPADDSSDEEEVFAVGEDDSDDEIQEYKERLKKMKSKSFKDKYGSDIEDSDDGLPSDKAWGLRKSKYYGADVSDEDLEDSESEDEAAKLEEQEARVIQQRLASQLHDKDLGLDLFQPTEKEKEPKLKEESQKKQIVKDLSKMSKKEKLKLLNKESPELLNLISEYKAKMTELKDRLYPVHKLIKNGTLPSSSAADFIEAQVRLYVNYCLNISFYMVLKSQHKPVQDHPVIQRILQFRQLIDQLNVQQDKMKPLVDDLLEKIKSGEEIVKNDVPEKKMSLISKIRHQRSAQEKRKKLEEKKKKRLERKKMEEEEDESDEMEEVLPPGGGGGRRKRKDQEEEFDETEEGDRKKSRKSEGDIEDDLGVRVEGDGDEDAERAQYEEFDGDEKRGITYEMEKNKGLTPRRKKIDRNPRVKNRMKFRKAKIRRRGQVREVRTEMSKYMGEMHGIRAGIKRSIKMK